MCLPLAILCGAGQQRFLCLLRRKLRLQRLRPHLEDGLLGVETAAPEFDGNPLKSKLSDWIISGEGRASRK